jgi:hypothetical protein
MQSTKENMQSSKEIIRQLHLTASVLKDLQITNIISCTINYESTMHVHLTSLTLSGISPVWQKLATTKYKWEKSCIYQGIKFFALYTNKEYLKENPPCKSN